MVDPTHEATHTHPNTQPRPTPPPPPPHTKMKDQSIGNTCTEGYLEYT